MKVGAVSLVLSGIALGLAAFGLAQTGTPTQQAPVRMDRIADLERQVEELSRRLDVEAQERIGIRTDSSVLPSLTPNRGANPAADDAEGPADAAERDATLTAIVDDAVDRKTT